MTNHLSRRTILRGAGVALTLPWMESLLPRTASAADAAVPLRYMPIFLPNGAPDYFVPDGNLNDWKLGSVLELLADVKDRVTVLKNLENGSAFNANGGSSVEPSHGRQPGAWLTCVDPASVKKRLNTQMEANGISVDQIMAAHAAFKGKTPLASLQVGLSTVESFCDNQQCSNSRSISWKTETQPMYKTVDPLTLFTALTKARGDSTVDPAAQMKLMAKKKSVIDAALENATATRAKLSRADQVRMDEFLEAVRAAEIKAVQVSGGMGGMACDLGLAPTMPTVSPKGITKSTATYNKGNHADAINSLVALAFQCDLTRIITYMLEDERSEFVYDHVPKRTFNRSESSAPSTGTCPEWHAGGQHGDANGGAFHDFATIVRWNVGKVGELCKKLDAVKEANGKSVLDNTVIFFGGAMHGDNHACNQLPTLLIGSGGGKLKQGQFVKLTNRPLRDLHFTIMNKVFDMNQTSFGANLTGAPISVINEIVA